jgi:tripartite-type tricarboxylate transporter receptor subunit TctC
MPRPCPSSTPRRGLLALALAAAPALAARAQGWPERPLRILVGFPPGGAIDTMVRAFSQKLSEVLGQPVVVENRPGAGSTIATEIGARSAPDGYTLVLGTMGTLVVNPIINKELSYNPYADLVPVALVADVANVLVIPPSRPWRDVGALIAAAKAAPNSLSWGYSGVGTSGHLTGHLLDRMAGIETVSVGYRGGAPLATDLMAGRVDYAFSTVASVLPQIREGKLRAIAVPTAQRQPWLAEVPTVAESAIPGFASLNWGGLVAPRGTPQAVIARLDAAMRETLADRTVVETMARNGLTPMIGGPEEFRRQWESDRERWEPVIRASGATTN